MNNCLPVFTFVCLMTVFAREILARALSHPCLLKSFPCESGEEPVKGWVGSPSSCPTPCCRKGGTNTPIPWFFIWLFISPPVIQQGLRKQKWPIQ